MSVQELDDWEKLLSAERQLQTLLPDAILVGGTATAIHTKHRVSLDGDHILSELRSNFDAVLRTLESVSGWSTSRTT